MAEQPANPSEAKQEQLRIRAEARLRVSASDIKSMSDSDVRRLVHELQVHQVELEIQNEELRHTQEQLAQALSRYSSLYEFSPVGYISLDDCGVIEAANLTSAKMLGVGRESLIGCKLSNFVLPSSQDNWHLRRREMFAQERPVVFELRMLVHGRQHATYRFHSVACPEGPGAPQHCQIAMSDISEQQIAYDALNKLNINLSETLPVGTNLLDHSIEQVRLLAEAIAHLGEGVMITSDELDWPGPEIIFVNHAMCQMSGYDAQELIGKSPRFLQGNNTDAKVRNRIRKDLQSLGSTLVELVNYRKDGSPYEVELFITPLFNQAGKRTHFVSVQRDLTQRKATQEALRSEHEFNTNIVNTSQHVTLVLDTAGRIVGFNPYLEKLTGWQHAEAIGLDWFDAFVPAGHRQATREFFYQTLAGSPTCGNVSPILTKDKRKLQIEWYDAPLTDSTGKLIGLLCTGQDVTQRLELERHVLDVASDEQRKIGTDLHDVVGQELTGLSLIAAALSIALKRESRPEVQFAHRIEDGVHRALTQVRALSRGLNPVDIDGQGLMSALTEMAARLNDTYGVRCTFECGLPVVVCDNQTATQLYRIAQEATTNAIRHAHPSQLAIQLEASSDSVTLRVSDNGMGMKASETASHALPAMGLRTMYYRAGIIGGRLTVQPRAGGGTEVQCKLPVRKATPDIH
jgi:two-component system sensor kinase FixL